ncbi:MAG: hypothetical protein FD127_3156 [Acidimicrobiaceae bacterium]|nr:MAG: hypothetical protein FD127_3156 [Acidimicrobiaceae bacterium]
MTGSNGSAVADDVLAVAKGLVATAPNSTIREQAQAVVDRLSGPLQVAIAGRVKAGKSTLLNALVGERLAPTDAGECTKIVSCYRRGSGYEVVARMRDGRREALGFTRSGGSLDIKLGALDERDIETIDVSWPTSTLEAITLIDTPGLASINDENSRRTRATHTGPTSPFSMPSWIAPLRRPRRLTLSPCSAVPTRSVPGGWMRWSLPRASPSATRSTRNCAGCAPRWCRSPDCSPRPGSRCARTRLPRCGCSPPPTMRP